MDWGKLGEAVLTIVLALIGGGASAFVVSYFSRHKTNAEAQKTLTEADKLKQQLTIEREKAEQEAQDRIAQLWRTAAGNYEEQLKKAENRIDMLERREQDNSKKIDSLNLALQASRSALRYLIQQVEGDYPEAVKIAMDVADMKIEAPVNGSRHENDDPSETHD